MKLNENSYNFAKKLLKLHDKEYQLNLSNLTPEINNQVLPTNNKDSKSPEIIDQRRILGGTDYKKFENIAKNTEFEEIKNDSKTKDALKMGCNNDFRKERQLLDKPSKDKLEAAIVFKNEGDDLLKEKKFQDAINSYEKGLLQLFYTFSEDLSEDRAVDKIKGSINMNISMCKMSLGKYEEAINCCLETLRVDKCNLKAMYRIAFSYFKLDKFEEARKQIKEALVIDQNEKLFLDLEKQILDKEKENDLKTAKMFKKIMK